MATRSLDNAKNKKQDEFYTQLSDIENELKHYKSHFRGKVVLCNCDDPRVSNFFRYFALNFKRLGLKKLITTCYKNQNPDLFSECASEKAVYLEYDGTLDITTLESLQHIPTVPLKGNGSYDSPECIELLKEADIVVTNPPFSHFRDYLNLLLKYDKKFLIIGSQNAITYKEIFPLLKNNIIWLGYRNGDMSFTVPDDYEARDTRYWVDETGQKWRSMGNICWFTNLDIEKRHEELILTSHYIPENYPKFDNYDAISVDKVVNIPIDYEGMMGVPITFMSKYNPDQFEIINGIGRYACIDDEIANPKGTYGTDINGKHSFFRILIKHKK